MFTRPACFPSVNVSDCGSPAFAGEPPRSALRLPASKTTTAPKAAAGALPPLSLMTSDALRSGFVAHPAIETRPIRNFHSKFLMKIGS